MRGWVGEEDEGERACSPATTPAAFVPPRACSYPMLIHTPRACLMLICAPHTCSYLPHSCVPPVRGCTPVAAAAPTAITAVVAVATGGVVAAAAPAIAAAGAVAAAVAAAVALLVLAIISPAELG